MERKFKNKHTGEIKPLIELVEQYPDTSAGLREGVEISPAEEFLLELIEEEVIIFEENLMRGVPNKKVRVISSGTSIYRPYLYKLLKDNDIAFKK